MDRILRAWAGASLALLLAGMVWWLAAPQSLSPATLLNAGLVLLLVTPVLKLLSVLAEEIRARDWRFAGLGFIVLLLLCGSLIVGFAR